MRMREGLAASAMFLPLDLKPISRDPGPTNCPMTQSPAWPSHDRPCGGVCVSTYAMQRISQNAILACDRTILLGRFARLPDRWTVCLMTGGGTIDKIHAECRAVNRQQIAIAEDIFDARRVGRVRDCLRINWANFFPVDVGAVETTQILHAHEWRIDLQLAVTTRNGHVL